MIFKTNFFSKVKGSPHEVSDLKQELLKAKSHIDSLNFKLSSNVRDIYCYKKKIFILN